MQLRSLAVLTCVLSSVLLVPSSARADEYGKWVKDEKAQTYTCHYTYTTKTNQVGTQTAVIYYADPVRKDWAYFYNTKSEPWARCATPTNKLYNPKVMYWQALDPTTKAKYIDYSPMNYCPAPPDGVKPIATLPLPPP